MNQDWMSVWSHEFGFAAESPQWFIALVGLILIYVFIVLPSGAMIAYLDRKMGADFQARVGPSYAGPAGMFQPFADLIKLLQKNGGEHWSWREAVWISVHTMALYSTVAVLPLGSAALLVDTDMSAFLPFWSSLVLALGTMLLGLSQRSISGLFGGIRIACQALAGAFPALVALICAGLRPGSFRWSAIVAVQKGWIFQWTAFANPFQFIAFGVFVISGLVLLGIPPMDAGLSLPDIHGGVFSHLQGRTLSLFRVGRFYGFFLWSVIAIVLFLGGWNLPFGVSEALKENESYGWLQLLELTWVLLKTFLLMLGVLWIGRVNPRSRIDQITDFSWKVLSPLALGSLIGSTLWMTWVSG